MRTGHAALHSSCVWPEKRRLPHWSTPVSTKTAFTAWRPSGFRAPPGSPDVLYFPGGRRRNSSSSNSRRYARRGSPPVARERQAPITPLTPDGHRPLFRGMPQPVSCSGTGGEDRYLHAEPSPQRGRSKSARRRKRPAGRSVPGQRPPPGQCRETNSGSAHPAHVPQRSDPARQSLAPDPRTTVWWGQGCARPYWA